MLQPRTDNESITNRGTGVQQFHKDDLLPVKSNAVGLEDSFAESILCKSGTNSNGIAENASLDK